MQESAGSLLKDVHLGRLMFILCAHNGRTLELNVQASTRVSALQQAVSQITGVPASEQIVMCDGAPLDPNRTLAAYKLPVEDPSITRDVFLYCKAHLRSGATLPPPQQLTPFNIDVPPPGATPHEPHILDSATSPLLRTLPAYERSFRYHVQKAEEHGSVCLKYSAMCQQLVSEQEVQALAIDAARVNVEHHYQYICGSYGDFMDRYKQQHERHGELLQRFAQDMELLASITLHEGASTDRIKRLIDMVPEQRLREWAENCRRSHEQFADKVQELEQLFVGLKADVEALFMQAPSVDLDDLGRRMEGLQKLIEDQNSVLAVLRSDQARVERLVQDAVGQLTAAASASSVQPLDACYALEVMNDSHTQQLLPRVEQPQSEWEAFAGHCVDCKNCMTADVFGQLNKISAQQSKIRSMRNKLVAFREVANKQQEAFAELQLLRRVPTAYRHCLAECVRRTAFAELYAAQAGKLAEHMAKLRAKETAQREAFKKHVERFIPTQVLHNMGLDLQPPHCSVSIPPGESGLLQVTLEDVRRLPRPDLQASVAAGLPFKDAGTPAGQSSRDVAASQALQPLPGQMERSSPGLSPMARAASSSPRSTPFSAGAPTQEEEALGPAAEEEGTEQAAAAGESLEIENARLRCELASQIALDCARSALAGRDPAAVPTSAGSSPDGGAPSGAGGLGASGLLRSVSVPAVQGSVVGLGAWAGTPTQAGSVLVPGHGQPQGTAAAQTAGGAEGLAVAAERFQEALAAKDELLTHLDGELAERKRQAAAYEGRVRALEATLAQLSASHAAAPGDPPPIETAEEPTDAASSSQPLVASLGAELPAAGAQTAAPTAAQTVAPTAAQTAAPTVAQTAAGAPAGDLAPPARAHDSASGSGLQQGRSAAPLLQVQPADIDGKAGSDSGSAHISSEREAAAPLQQPTQPSGAASSPAAAASEQHAGSAISLTGSGASEGREAAPSSPQQRGPVSPQEAFGSPAAVEVLSTSSDGPGGTHPPADESSVHERHPSTLARPVQQPVSQVANTAPPAGSPGCEPAVPGPGALAGSQDLEPPPHEAVVSADTGTPTVSQHQRPPHLQSQPQGTPQARPVGPPSPQEAP